jgi:NADH-quinone oxidoreductase subunit L
VVVAGFALALMRYKLAPVKAGQVGRPRTALHALLLNAYYVDALYDRAIVRPLYALSVVLARVFDLGVIDGIVNGVGRGVVAGGAALRRVQTGYVVNYALTMLAGAVLVVAFLLAR